MTMIDLAAVTRESFTPFIGQTFEVILRDGRLPLTLADARLTDQKAPGAIRDPFVLTFHGKASWRFPQQIYRLENPELGTIEIFVVQTGATDRHSEFEAVFC